MHLIDLIRLLGKRKERKWFCCSGGPFGSPMLIESDK
jgi:hypothetical protein